MWKRKRKENETKNKGIFAPDGNEKAAAENFDVPRCRWLSGERLQRHHALLRAGGGGGGVVMANISLSLSLIEKKKKSWRQHHENRE